MAHFVETYRALLTGGSVSWESIFYILVSTGGVIVFGRRFFHNHAPTFAKEL
jgi:ABC-type polysaccharide/polyol phosphate export permease